MDAIIDPVPSTVALGVQDLARERNKMVIVASSGLADVTGKNCTPTSFQWAYDTLVVARGTASTVAKEEGSKNWFFITSDVAFGHSLANESKAVVLANGGTVKGEVRHPYITADFSSFILQAQASGADVIALANSGADMTNSVRQAIEFGIGQGKTRLVALLAFVTDVKSLGLDQAKGLLLTESFYWDLNDETRAWSKRFGDRFGGRMPSMAQAAVYSGVSHYLKAIKAAGTTDAKVVADKMREMPINDFMIRNGRARKDGRIVHDFYLFQVKAPQESKGPWDLYKLVRTIPAAEVTPPEGSTGCPCRAQFLSRALDMSVWIEVALNGPWTRARQKLIPITVEEIVAEGIARGPGRPSCTSMPTTRRPDCKMTIARLRADHRGHPRRRRRDRLSDDPLHPIRRRFPARRGGSALPGGRCSGAARIAGVEHGGSRLDQPRDLRRGRDGRTGIDLSQSGRAHSAQSRPCGRGLASSRAMRSTSRAS